MKENNVYTGIFITSVLYAPILSLWKRTDPISYIQTTWLQTVIGVGYVLLWLRLLLTASDWLKVCAAFFFSSLPVITRSLIETGLQNNAFSNYGDD